ncbi:MAG: hypothetical protein KGS72_10355 [Cyanobacteria bacterium REEB67]|nr:hypothetical protein [Cyanobacteria bacterium REEB67]
MQTIPVDDEMMIEDVRTSHDLLPLALCLVAVIILAGSSIFFWYCHPLLIFCDQGLYMHMAQLLLQGKVPYVDMFEINPPLAIYLHTPPVLAASFFHLTQPFAFALYIWTLILISSLVGGLAAWRSGSRGALYVSMAAILGMVFFSRGQTLDFGQRDHIFAILYFPFFLVRYLRWQGLKNNRALGIIAGILGGIGIALKHYFVPVALAAEVVWVIDKKSLRPLLSTETVAASLTLLLYGVHFVFLPKGELQTFFGFIVPIYQAGYSYYMTSLSYNVFWSRPDLYLMAATTIGALALARRSSFVLPLQAFSLMSAAIFVLAGQVWTCHTMSTRMASDIALCVQALLCARFLPAFTRRGRLGPTILGLALIAFAVYHVKDPVESAMREHENGDLFWVKSLKHSVITPKDDIEACSKIVLNYTQPDDSILFISSAMAPGYPVFQQCERKPASRLLHGMVLPILSSLIEDPDQSESRKGLFQSRLRQIFDWYEDDIAANKPKIIFVQIRFIYDLLRERGFFERQMAGYKVLKDEGDYRVYLREQ